MTIHVAIGNNDLRMTLVFFGKELTVGVKPPTLKKGGFMFYVLSVGNKLFKLADAHSHYLVT